jgi:geranylgeranyl diphosphate synthase type II
MNHKLKAVLRLSPQSMPERNFNMDFQAYVTARRRFVNEFLKYYLTDKPANSWCPKKLSKSMGYSLMAGGKRIRPLLAIASYEAAGGRSKNIIPVAVSLELIHTYSLIHDDLPAMDNDDFRRNKPTNHKVFGEAIAILAGDALLTDAFDVIVKTKAKPKILMHIIKELTHACGTEGMVGGQAADILFEDKKIRIQDLEYIHIHKTGALIRASVRIGALMAEASPRILKSLTQYGERIGLAFQIADDILDVTGNRKELGKTTGADKTKGKNTYPYMYGLEKSKHLAEDLVSGSLQALEKFDKKAEPLREIAKYIINRRS